MQRFGFGVPFSQLRDVQRKPDVILDASWKRLHGGSGIGEPREFLHALVHAYIGISRIASSKESDPGANRSQAAQPAHVDVLVRANRPVQSSKLGGSVRNFSVTGSLGS